MKSNTSSKFLEERGISEKSIEAFGLSDTGERIIIPVRDKNGKFLFNKYRLYPKKQYLYDAGAEASLFGLEFVNNWCVLCEGELDAVRLHSIGIPAVSGTGGAGTFKQEWVSELPEIVFICYDSDDIGRESAKKVHWMIPGSKIIELPTETKDVTDFLRSRTYGDFVKLMAEAISIPKPLPSPKFRVSGNVLEAGTEIEKAKSVPIHSFIKVRDKLALCVWHNDHSPSMHYYEKENRVWCFSCSQGGDAIDVYMKVHGLSFREAITKLNS